MYYQFQAPVLSIRVDSIIGGIRGMRGRENVVCSRKGEEVLERGVGDGGRRTVGAGIGRDI